MTYITNMTTAALVALRNAYQEKNMTYTYNQPGKPSKKTWLLIMREMKRLNREIEYRETELVPSGD